MRRLVGLGLPVVRRLVVVPLVLVVLIGLGGRVLGAVYADGLLLRLVLGAAIGSVAVGVAVHRLPSWLVAPVSVAALAGYTALAVRLSARHADLPGSVAILAADAARNGIPRLLTALIPIEPLPDTVLVPVVAAWLAGLAGTEVALRTGRVLLSYLPATLFYASALYVVGPNARPAIWPTVGFVAAAATGLTVGARGTAESGAGTAGASAASRACADRVATNMTGHSAGGADGVDGAGPEFTPAVRAALRLRRLAGTAAGLAVVVALSAAVGPVVAGRTGDAPVDPRRYVQPPRIDSLDESPLIRISGWALNPRQELFDLTSTTLPRSGSAPPPDGSGPAGDEVGPDDGQASGGSRPGNGLRIRLAVLSDYDGVTWQVGATYRNAGRVLPRAPIDPDATVDLVRQQITIAGLSGRLLPAVATPQQVAGARVAYDASSGTLIRPEGLTAGVRYEVISAREQPDLNQLATADVPAGDAVARVLRVPDGVPDQLRTLADQLASDNGAPYARASTLEQFLSEHYRLVSDAPSGHAYPNLRFFLFGPRSGGGQRGTSEQFAAAYAVLGRLMGLPTRVVVGFTSATGSGPVRAGDAYAWPEVLFAGLGWVAFDPLPRPDSEPRPVEEDVKPKPEEPPPTPDQATPSSVLTPSASSAAAAAVPPPHGVGTPVLVGGGAGAVLVLLAAMAGTLVLLRRGQRRRRLREGTPAHRVAGAWREVTDALRLAGHQVAGHLAATEVAAHARTIGTGAPATADPTGPTIDRLAGLVNQCAFAPSATADEQAGQAAAEAVAYATALRARRPWWRRLLWSMHPGPLRWRQ